MTFGMAYLAAVALIAALRGGKVAYAALPPLVVTVGLWWLAVPNASAYSSAAWALAGLFLIHQGLKGAGIPRNGELLAGVLYGISGLVYVSYYFGAEHATLAIIPIISDVAFGIGLVVGTWPSLVARTFSLDRHSPHRTAVQIAKADLARSSMLDGAEG